MGTSTSANPTYMYTTPGVYDVTLTVYGLGGTASYTRSGYINITTPNFEVSLGSINPIGSATLDGIGSYAYNSVATLEVTPTGSSSISAADVVLMVATPLSMAASPFFLSAKIPFIITQLEADLLAGGIGTGADTNKYALVGFEDGTTIPVDTPTKKTVGGGDWGTAAQLNTALGLLAYPFTAASQKGDGYAACQFALANYTFRSGAPKVFIIVSNEERQDITSGSVTKANTQALLSAANVILNVIVEVQIFSTEPPFSDYSTFARNALSNTLRGGSFDPTYVNGTFSSWSYLPITNNELVVETYCEFCGELGGYEWRLGLASSDSYLAAFGDKNTALVTDQITGSATFDYMTLNGGSHITTNPYPFNVVTDTVVDVYTT